MKSKNTILTEEANKIFKNYGDDIDDIILFGSYVKGSNEYNDIDILMIFKKKINKTIETEFKNKLDIPKLDINSITLEELKGDGFIAKEGLYLEGKSLVSGKFLNEILGFTSIAFIRYDISKILGSSRTRLYYALYGRGGSQGFLKEIKARKYSDNIIICDYLVVEKVKEFLEHWKIEYEITPALVPKRLKNVLLLNSKK